MHRIILHSPARDRRDDYRDAGAELSVGLDDDRDIDPDAAQALIDAQRAVDPDAAAVESDDT